jgi:hypothetical protein
LDTPHTYNSKVGADYGIHFEKAEYLATNGKCGVAFLGKDQKVERGGDQDLGEDR